MRLLQASHAEYDHSHQSLEESQSWAQSPSEAQEKNQHTQTLPPVSGLRQQGGTSQQRSTAKATAGSNRAHTAQPGNWDEGRHYTREPPAPPPALRSTELPAWLNYFLPTAPL